MAVGTMVFGRSAYENVVCVGLLVDETGRKMSKHLGNVLEPLPLMDAHGADALRWFFAASGSPWGARRVGHDVLAEIVRKVLLTYWNTASFLVLYANAGGWTAADLCLRAARRGPAADRPVDAQRVARGGPGCHGVARGLRHGGRRAAARDAHR